MARRRGPNDAYPDDKRYNEPFYDPDDPRAGAAAERDDDDAVGTHVRGELVRNQRVDPSDIDVDVHDGVVTLHGRVRTNEEKQEAERVTLGLDGVREVRNELSVSE